MMSDVVSAVLLLLGATLSLLGAWGLVRLPDVPARLQAATKPQTLGLLLIVAGAALRVQLDGALTLALVALFQVITAPVLSQLILQSAYRSGMARWEVLVVDELAGRTNAPQGEGAADPPPGP